MSLTVRDSPTLRDTSAEPARGPSRPQPRPPRQAWAKVLVLTVAALIVANLAVVAGTQLAHRDADSRTTQLDGVRSELTDAREIEARQRAELMALEAEVASLRAGVDEQVAVLASTTGARDQLREQLIALGTQLHGVQAELDSTFVTILGQNDVIEHLRGCFGGVQRALNLAAFEREQEAALAVLQVAEQCANAQSALRAGAQG